MKFTQTVVLIGSLASTLVVPTWPIHAQGSSESNSRGTTEPAAEPSSPATPQAPVREPSSPGDQSSGAVSSPAQPSGQGTPSDLEKAVAKAILAQEQGHTDQAIQSYRNIIERFDRQRTAVAQAIFRLGEAYRSYPEALTKREAGAGAADSP